MGRPSRRKFLRTVGQVAAGTALLGPLARSSRASASARRGRTGTIADVKHVVILMQENRSFDHYFGTLRGVRGFADTATISLPGLFSVFEQQYGAARQFPFPLRGPDGLPDPEILAQCQEDIPHGWADQHQAWNGGRLDNWMDAKKKLGALSYLDRTDLPFYYALADAYTLCDAYFCSALTATGPNRAFLWSGSIDAAGKRGGPAYDGGDASGLGWRTYAHALEAAGIRWRVYQNSRDNFGNNGLAYFSAFDHASERSPLYRRGMRDVARSTGSTAGDILAAIRNDVLADKLPEVSWIVTDEATSEHPVGPPVNGESFVYQLLHALNARPETLDSTLLIVTYDENGGFFDHVPPPVPPAGTPDEFVRGQPVGLGFRVPTLLISPWTRGGWVSSEVFDHTSILQFLERWSSASGRPARCPLISRWRRSVCGDLTSAFDFGAPVFGLPELPRPGARIPLEACKGLASPMPRGSQRPAQEPGVRPARPVPYQPNAWISSLTSRGETSALTLTLSNDGGVATKPASFAVYANAHRADGPWPYTVRAGATTSDVFDLGPSSGDGQYDFTVTGPNRFLRRMTGDARAPGRALEAVALYGPDAATGRPALWLVLENRSSQPVTFLVRAGAYRAPGSSWSFEVEPGGRASQPFDVLGHADGWYDLTVTASLDASWSRRCSGHLETGEASVSGNPLSSGHELPLSCAPVGGAGC
jgi:phospholipase C